MWAGARHDSSESNQTARHAAVSTPTGTAVSMRLWWILPHSRVRAPALLVPPLPPPLHQLQRVRVHAAHGWQRIA